LDLDFFSVGQHVTVEGLPLGNGLYRVGGPTTLEVLDKRVKNVTIHFEDLLETLGKRIYGIGL
jgi:hypothetical protein